MPAGIASIVFAVGIAGLFWLNRDRRARTSVALWIPVIWMLIVCSRPVSLWLEMGSPMRNSARTMEGSPLDRAVYSCMLVAGIAVLFTRRKAGRILRANGPLLFSFSYCLFTILWSDFPEIALKRWPKALGDLAMVLIVLTDPQPIAAFKQLLARLSFVLIPLSILFFKYLPQLGMGWNRWTGDAIFTGVTTNKNMLGAVCLCLGLGAMWRLITVYRDRGASGRTRKMIAHGVIFLTILYLFRLMDSMTSLSCFLMAGVLLVVGNTRAAKRRPMIVHFLVVSMVAVSAAVLFLQVSPGALKAMGRNPTLTDRTIIWGEMLSQVRNPIFGTGFQSFWLGPRLDAIWLLQPTLRPNEAHNGYLEVYLNMGWVGIALLGFVLATGYRTAFKAWRSNDPRGPLLVAYFFCGLVYNFTEAAFFQMQAVAWLFFLLAITRRPRNLKMQSPIVETEVAPSPWSVDLRAEELTLSRRRKGVENIAAVSKWAGLDITLS